MKRGRQRDKVFEESVDLKSIIKMLYLTSTSHIQHSGQCSDAATNDFREHKSGSRKVFFFFSTDWFAHHTAALWRRWHLIKKEVHFLHLGSDTYTKTGGGHEKSQTPPLAGS